MIYFNNAADSFPKLECVNQFLCNQEYFVSGRECKCQTDSKKKVTEIFRDKIKEILKLPDGFHVTITPSATESANLVIQSFFKQSTDSNYVVYDFACHNSIIRPCHELYGDDRCFVHKNCLCEPCLFDGDSMFDCLTNNHRKMRNCQMIIFSYESNSLGYVMRNPKELVHFINHYTDLSRNTALILDITQAIGNTEFNFQKLFSEFDYRNIYIFGTTHKALGSISGTGFLVHPEKNNLTPLIYGGTGVGDHHQPREFPHYLESGTYNITSIACANKALDYSMNFMDIECQAKSQLVSYFISKYKSIENSLTKKYLLLQNHWINPSSGIINLFPINETVGDFITTQLFSKGFVTRFGCHCCSKYKYLNSGKEYRMSIRLSFNAVNTNSEIDKFIDALSDTIMELVKHDR